MLLFLKVNKNMMLKIYKILSGNIRFGLIAILLLCWFLPKGQIDNIYLLLFLISCLGYLSSKPLIIFAALCYLFACFGAFTSHVLLDVVLLMISILFYNDMIFLYKNVKTNDKQSEDDHSEINVVIYIYLISLLKVLFNIVYLN